MEWLRSCYRSFMRPYPDRPDIVVPGCWRWCPEGALPLPVPHVFESRQWDFENPVLWEPDVGEIHPRGAWYGGGNGEGVDGLHYHGDPNEWLGRVPYSSGRVGVHYAGCDPASCNTGGEWGTCQVGPNALGTLFVAGIDTFNVPCAYLTGASLGLEPGFNGVYRGFVDTFCNGQPLRLRIDYIGALFPEQPVIVLSHFDGVNWVPHLNYQFAITQCDPLTLVLTGSTDPSADFGGVCGVHDWRATLVEI